MIFKTLFTIHYSLFTKKGFTLSEVMVTMGILGVLAAFIVPAVMNNTPDNNKVMFKKAYYSLEQGVSSLINDDTNYPSDQTLPISSVTYERGFNYTIQTPPATYFTNNKFCTLLSDELNILGTVSCPAHNLTGTGTFTTTDGISWNVRIPVNDDITYTTTDINATTEAVQFPLSSTSYALKIIVDVNGPNKRPNCSADTSFATYAPTGGNPAYSTCNATSPDPPCKNDPDTFIIGVRYDGKLRISATGSSDACAADILSNPTSNIR